MLGPRMVRLCMETRYQIETQRVGKQLPLPPSSTSMVTVVPCAVWSGLPSSDGHSPLSGWVDLCTVEGGGARVML